MAQCLHPLTIRNPQLNGKLSACPPAFWKDNLRPYFNDSLVVPCGKCINCLKNRQSSMAVRIKREAEKKGSLVFLTLTYDDDHLPLAQSLWKINRDTGEYILECPAEIISSGRNPDPVRLGQMKELVPSPVPRYIDVPIPAFSVADPEHDYFARITPSCCREDVRLWIKRCRSAYKYAFKKDLDFSYCVVSELGPRTCRPHYHIAVMGLQGSTVEWFANQWSYGFTKTEQVKPSVRQNEDPFSAVAFYIGKYMSKGKFECESVRNGSAEKHRVCQSLGLGTGDFEKHLPYFACFDMYGKYDLNLLTLENGSKLSGVQISKLCEEIPKRLVYKLNSRVTLPLPRLLRNKLFFVKDKYEKPVKTAIWYLVTSSLRDKYAALDQQEFEQFLSGHPERTIAENCASFKVSKEYAASLEIASGETDLQEFYNRSIF